MFKFSLFSILFIFYAKGKFFIKDNQEQKLKLLT